MSTKEKPGTKDKAGHQLLLKEILKKRRWEPLMREINQEKMKKKAIQNINHGGQLREQMRHLVEHKTWIDNLEKEI